MYQTGFDNKKYVELQSKHILSRIEKFENKLYLEFGGKLFHDLHASRVLPGFDPNNKIHLLKAISDKTEIIMVINAGDIEGNRLQGDNGITYGEDLLRLTDALSKSGLFVSSVVITKYAKQSAAKLFKRRLEQQGITVYLHYPIQGYPANIPHILSDAGFGQNDYVKTERPLVVVTAPGASSGKMATCFSQMYHEYKRGIKAGYAKFETFPIWNLPINHPVNLAYEAATTNVADVNMIDPFHLEAYGTSAVNYNRDVEGFPVLNAIFKEIWGESPYKSPTDMGVNMIFEAIENDEVCRAASRQEIIRRYFSALCHDRAYGGMESEIETLLLLMNKAGATTENRTVVGRALTKEIECGKPSMAIQLPNGDIITGRTTELLGAASATLLNALKHLAGVDDAVKLLSPEMIEPIKRLKLRFFRNTNPHMHTDEILIALSICTATNPLAEHVISALPKLQHSEAHSSVMLSQVDMGVFRNLGINLTCEPKYQFKRSYYK